MRTDHANKHDKANIAPRRKHLQNNETKRQLSLVSCSAGLGGRAGAGCLLWLNHHHPEAPSTCAACTQGPPPLAGDQGRAQGTIPWGPSAARATHRAPASSCLCACGSCVSWVMGTPATNGPGEVTPRCPRTSPSALCGVSSSVFPSHCCHCSVSSSASLLHGDRRAGTRQHSRVDGTEAAFLCAQTC